MNRSGSINITSSYVDNAYTGSVFLNTGDSLTVVSGDIEVGAGSGVQSGANVTVTAGDAHDSTASPVAIQSGTSYFNEQRTLAGVDAAPMAGAVSMIGGSAANGIYGHGGNFTGGGGKGASYGGSAHLTGGDVNDGQAVHTRYVRSDLGSFALSSNGFSQRCALCT